MPTLPRYIQISEFLMREIAAGRLQEGQRIPPEREIAQDLGVSVGTLRKALAVLEEKGLLNRVQGSGNYIQHSDTSRSIYSMFRLELLEGGGLPRADVLSVDIMTKPDDLPAFGTHSKATRIRRKRYLNDISIALEEIWLDASAGVLEDEISDSLYHTYRTQLGLTITRAEDRVSMAPVPGWTLFNLAAGTQTGYVERFAWGDATHPLEFSRTWFDTTKAVYVQRLK